MPDKQTKDIALTIPEIKKVLTEFCNTIPPVLTGPDRITYLLDNIEKMSSDKRILLRNYINKLLASMIEMEASDIEIGGHGNAGYIWLRIHGDKERIKEFIQITDDEAALFIINLLNSNQRKHLALTRNLDFSYTFYYTRKSVDVRFRADAYFDLDGLALNMRAINSAIRPLDSYGFHPNVVRTLSHTYIKNGLTLITGITGSGKSTTLDAIVDAHNQIDPAHVVIIASPVHWSGQASGTSIIITS